jgi:hypothetical protein
MSPSRRKSVAATGGSLRADHALRLAGDLDLGEQLKESAATDPRRRCLLLGCARVVRVSAAHGDRDVSVEPDELHDRNHVTAP